MTDRPTAEDAPGVDRHSGSRWEPIAALPVDPPDGGPWTPAPGRHPGGSRSRRTGLAAVAAVGVLALGGAGGFALARAAGGNAGSGAATVQDGGTGFTGTDPGRLPGRSGFGDRGGVPGDGVGPGGAPYGDGGSGDQGSLGGGTGGSGDTGGTA